MKTFPGYTDLFMSPVTGLLLIPNKQGLTNNYVWVGNRDNVAIESPDLIDLKLNIINLRKRLDNTPFIIQFPSPDFYNSQALSEVNNGLIANLNGVIVPATLTENNLWIGDSNNIPQPNPTIQLGNLPNLTYNYFWIGDSSNRPVETNTFPIDSLPPLPYQNIWIGNMSNRPIPNQRIGNINLPPFVTPDPTSNFGIYNLYTGGTVNVDNFINDPGPVPSTTLRIDMSNMPNLSTGKIWMGVVNAVPPGLTVDTTYPYFHLSSGSLNWDALGILIDSHAVPQEVGLDPGTIFMGDFSNPGQIIQTGLPFGRMFIGNGFGQLTNVGLLPYQLFSGNPDASGQIIPITILDRTNLPILPLDNVWVGDGLDQAFPIPVGIGLNTISGLNIADTTVVPGSYISANITVNAQGQITAAANGEGSGGTVTEITLGTGLTGIPNPIIETGNISISDTGVVAGEYFYLTATINAQGQIISAIDNDPTITDMQDNISTNTTNIATNTSDIATLNTAVFAPVTGLVAIVFDSFGGIGLLGQINNNTDKISEIVDASDTYISQIEENTSNIANNTSDIAGIIAGIIPISTNFTGVGDVSGSGPLSSSITLTLNTPLNNVPLATSDVNINNYKIINLDDATNPKDAVNLETLESYVGGLSVELEGFVEGGPAVGGILTTTRGPDCTLDVIPAAADVSFGNFAITDLGTLDFSNWPDMEAKAQNGINFLFFWKFFGGGVS